MDQSSTQNLISNEFKQRLKIIKAALIIGVVFSILNLTLVLIVSTDQIRMIRIATTNIIEIIVLIGAFFLVKRNIIATTHIIIVVTSIIISISVITNGITIGSIAGLMVPVTLSALLLSPRWTIFYSFIIIVAFLVGVSIPFTVRRLPLQTSDMITGVMFFVLISGISYLTAIRSQHFFTNAINSTRDLEQAQQTLEARIQERTASLQASLDENRASHEMIRQLNVPILQIADGIMLLPLLGTISAQRMQQIANDVLAKTHQIRPRAVIIDLTGISTPSSTFTHDLMLLTAGLQLLGTKTIIVGIHADLARTLGSTPFANQQLVIKRDVQQGLAYALNN